MNTYEISPNLKVDYGASGKAALLQNAAFFLGTKIGTCPMDRTFGWDPPVDEMLESAKAKASAGIIEGLQSVFPTIQVEEVQFDESYALEGKLYPIVKVVIIDG